MSSTESGTQSPPLEATGEHKPMGFSSVQGQDRPIEVVPDKEQRRDYLQGTTSETPSKPEKLGHSLSDKLDGIN